MCVTGGGAMFWDMRSFSYLKVVHEFFLSEQYLVQELK